MQYGLGYQRNTILNARQILSKQNTNPTRRRYGRPTTNATLIQHECCIGTDTRPIKHERDAHTWLYTATTRPSQKEYNAVTIPNAIPTQNKSNTITNRIQYTCKADTIRIQYDCIRSACTCYSYGVSIAFTLDSYCIRLVKMWHFECNRFVLDFHSLCISNVFVLMNFAYEDTINSMWIQHDYNTNTTR